MCAKWKLKTEHDFSTLLNKINIVMTGNIANPVTYNNLVNLLVSLIEFADYIPDAQQPMLTKQAISQLNENRDEITKENLINSISLLEEEYENKPHISLILLTTASLSYSNVMRDIRIGDTRVTFSRVKPRRFVTDRTDQQIRGYIYGRLPQNYTYLRIYTKARSEHEGAEKCLYTINYLRGIWNYILNCNRFRRTHIGREKPVNQILLGPIHTLHKLDGTPAMSTFWYEPTYLEPVNLKNVTRRWQIIREQEIKIRRWISSRPHSKELENAFRKYAQALDTWDMYDSFLKLWNLLEYLLATFKNDIIINRILFLIKDRNYQRLSLQNLRNFRNSYVHTAKSTDDVESYVYQVKIYVETLLQFHMLRDYRFSSICEAACFLDNSKKSEKLKNKIVGLKRELRNISHLQHNVRAART